MHFPHVRRLCVAVAHAVIAASLAVPPPASAASSQRVHRLAARELEDAAKTQVFAAALAPYGEWLEVPGRGIAWRPAAVADDWRPYVNGSWSWTAEGWYWVSAEPWAWATYHYGKWRFDGSLGWTWLPGGEWAPAWVVWRFGGGAVGWAPRSDDGDVLPFSWTFLPASRFARVDVAASAAPAPRVPLLVVNSRRAAGAAHSRGPVPLADEHAVALPGMAQQRGSRALAVEAGAPGTSSPARAHEAGR